MPTTSGPRSRACPPSGPAAEGQNGQGAEEGEEEGDGVEERAGHAPAAVTEVGEQPGTGHAAEPGDQVRPMAMNSTPRSRWARRANTGTMSAAMPSRTMPYT